MVEIKTQLKALCCFTYKLILHIQLALNTTFEYYNTNLCSSIDKEREFRNISKNTT